LKLSLQIEQAFSRHKSKPAFSHFVSSTSLRTVTYRQLEEKVQGLARFLVLHGMQPNDIVMSFMTKSIDAAVAMLAVLLNGGTACSLNPRLKAQQVVKLSALARPKFIILDRNNGNQIVKAEGAIAPDIQLVFYADVPEPVRRGGASKTGDTLPQSIHPVHITADGISDPYGGLSGAERSAYCLFTSGSTGDQKGVLISRDDLFARVSTEIEDYHITDADNLLSLLPFSFDVGLNQFFSSVLSGAHLVMLNSWFPKDVISVVKSCGISGISAVPTIWADLLCLPQPDMFREDIKTLRYITVSGGDLPSKYLLQLRQYFKNVQIYKTYGQSETFRSGILKPEDFDKKMMSVGRPVKGTRIFILDTNGTLAPPDGEGEIVHYGVGTMLRYINETEGPRNKIREIPTVLKDTLTHGKVVFTGDRGKIDKDGFLHVLGREDGMIKTMGYRVYPQEIERCILEHPQIKYAAVVGVPDSRKGQAAVAEVVTNSTLDKRELMAYLRERLPYYMVPVEVHLVGSLPLAENGKIRYAEIKGRHEERRFLCAHTEGGN
jgi:acyl-coenzyme A synthetase/AMP-(fatty) acid ligase